MASRFPMLHFAGFASNYDDGLNLILEFRPKIVFLEIDPEDAETKLSLNLINELYRYLKEVPKFIITTKGKELALDAIKHEVFDYLIKPLEISEFRKSILKFERSVPAIDAVSIPQEITTTVLPEMEPLKSKNGVEKTEEILSANEIMLPIVEMAEVEPQPVKIQHEDKPLIICVKS